MAIIDNGIPGASKNNPSKGARAPSKKARNSAALASGANPAGTSTASGTDLTAARHAIEVALGLLGQVDAAIDPQVQTAGPNDLLHKGKVPQNREALIGLIADLIRNHPEVAPVSTADDLDATTAYLGDLGQLASKLEATLAAVQNTRRLVLVDGWARARLQLSVAEHLAKRDAVLTTAITPIRQALKRVPRVISAQQVVVTSQRQTTLHQRQIDAAQHRAELAKLTQTAAEARRTGVVPAAPAPTPVPVPVPVR